MSRCFPFPPPGYSRAGASGEGLIESIKLQSDKVKGKSSNQKEKRRDKVSDRKDKIKRAEKLTRDSDGKVAKLNHQKDLQWEKRSIKSSSNDYRLKGKTADTEELEKSDLTVEHEQPICSQGDSYLSDSTQSNKRKRLDLSSLSSNGTRNPGIVLRFKMSSKKLKECDTSQLGEPSCSTSGREQGHIGPRKEIVNKHGKTVNKHDKTRYSSGESRFELQVPPLVPGIEAISVLESGLTDDGSASSDNGVPSELSLYKVLFEDWNPSQPPIQDNDFEDQDWLFRKKPEDMTAAKRCKANDVDSCRMNSCLWPRAQLLPEAYIYALPYSVPF